MIYIYHSFLQSWNPPPPPPFWEPPLSEANLKSPPPPLSESHPNWCM